MSKEKFRDWNFKNTIQIRYKDGNRVQKVWMARQHQLLNQIITIVDSYRKQGIMLTKRQLYYQLVRRNYIPNADEVYKRICSFTTDACYAGLIDWNAIEDRSRSVNKRPEWNSISDIVSSAIYQYRLPRWKDQEYYVELYCEKEAMESVFSPVANKFHVSFGTNKGYSSASMMYELSQRISGNIMDGKKTVILYFGDHDPSGLDMVRDIRERVTEFLTHGDMDYLGGFNRKDHFHVVPLALNMKQIGEYKPPPNPAKISDPRAKWYLEEYGDESWELDALEPSVLMKIAEEGIRDFLDVGKYQDWITIEDQQKEQLKKFASKIKTMEKT